MTRSEVEDLIRTGETSGAEFKRDEIENYRLAEVIVGFANTTGGVILLGVSDDGTVHGTTRDNLEEWVVDLCRTKIDPPIVPYLEWHREYVPGKDILLVRVLRGPFKAYSRLHNGRRNYFIRVGTTTREASPDELERLFQASGRLRYGAKPVPGAGFHDLDLRRLKDYFWRVLSQPHRNDTDIESWQRLLVNLEFMVRADDVVAPTIDGMSVAGADIMLSIFSDRLEVKSPGRLPNTATVEAIKAGYRYARNQTLVNVMRDYHYVEFRGMGIKDKVIPGMQRHNGTEPDFIETEYDFTVRLWKEKRH